MRQRVMTAKCIDIQKQPISRFRYETYKVQNFSMIKKKGGTFLDPKMSSSSSSRSSKLLLLPVRIIRKKVRITPLKLGDRVSMSWLDWCERPEALAALVAGNSIRAPEKKLEISMVDLSILEWRRGCSGVCDGSDGGVGFWGLVFFFGRGRV